jgi:hypothetical protein
MSAAFTGSSVIRPVSVRELPAPGAAAVEVVAADLRHQAGRRVVRMMVGARVLKRLRRGGARFAALIYGRERRLVVLPFVAEADFIESIAVGVVDLMPYISDGPAVLLPFGDSKLREKLVAAARLRELEMAPARGTA